MSGLPETIWHFWIRSFDGKGIDHKIITAIANPVTCNEINPKMISTLLLFHHIANTCALGITVHWIDDKFCLQQQLLSFIHLIGPHTGSLLASKVYQTLDECDLKKRLFCITEDNAANNMTMAKHLSNHLAIKDNIA